MRPTANLDPDVYVFAQAYAGGEGISLSAAPGELVRPAERAPALETLPGRLEKNEYGYLELAKSGHPLTPEMVRAAADDSVL